jgi:pimeloyl-ACP methyl ester carboxylesterase
MTSGALPSPLALSAYPEQNRCCAVYCLDHHAGSAIAGREDDLVPWSNNEYLVDLLPNSEGHPLDAGHFAWEQASDEYGRLIAEWVTRGFQRLVDAVTA